MMKDVINSLKVGDEVSRTFEISKSSLDSYAKLTGDNNPIHMNEAYARAAGFRGRVAHGMYLAGLVSRIIGEDMPGHGALWFAQDMSFEEPVYAGDRLTVTVKVEQLSQAARAVKVGVIARDGHGNVKFKGGGTVTMPKVKTESNAKVRSALVTGGSGGIGSAICRMLAGAGMNVLVGYSRDAARAEALCAEIGGKKRRCEPVCLDLSDGAALKRMVTRCGKIDTVVCCAMQTWRRKSFAELSAEELVEDFGQAVAGNAALLQAVLPGMVAAKFGRVVGICSSVVLGTPPAGQASYVAAKHAMVGLFKALQAEYAGSGITFNLVSPSLVDTGFTASLPERTRKALILQSPLERLCTPADVAEAVELLVKKDSFINGVNLPVTGGMG